MLLVVFLILNPGFSISEPFSFQTLSLDEGGAATAKISASGSVAIQSPYEGENDGSTLKFHKAGEPIKDIDVLPGEAIELIGFSDSDQIVAISRPSFKVQSLIYIDPISNSRRSVELTEGESGAGGGDRSFINDKNLVAVIHPTDFGTPHKIQVTFVTADLVKKSYTVQLSFPLNNGLASLSSSGNLLLSDYERKNYVLINQDGTVQDLGTNIFGVASSEITAYAIGTSDTVAAITRNKARNSAEVITLDLESFQTSKVEANVTNTISPSFENELLLSTTRLYQGTSLITDVISTGYSDSFYLGDSLIQITSSGTVSHLNCFVPPAAGRIVDIIDANAKGEALAVFRSPQGDKSLVKFESLNTEGAPNHCLQVAARFDKGCSKNFTAPAGGLRKNGYMYAVNIFPPSTQCKLNLTFKDANHLPVKQKRVVVRKEGNKRVKTYLTSASGRVKVDMTPILKQRSACGWSIFLEDLRNYQSNGIIVFRDTSQACHRE